MTQPKLVPGVIPFTFVDVLPKLFFVKALLSGRREVFLGCANECVTCLATDLGTN